MRISGLQKLTLLDFPGRVACTVFTGGCNFRCPFCHNAPLVLAEKMPDDLEEEELLRFLKTRQGILDGVAITGGEPLLYDETLDLLRKIRELGFAIKLDSNGSFPQRLRQVVDEKLADRVAMDIKNSPELYAKTSGLPAIDLGRISESKELLMASGIEYEFRTTVVRGIHTPESIRGAAEWIQGAKEYYLQQYVDSGNVLKPEGLGSFSAEEMTQLRDCAREFVPVTQLRGVEEKKSEGE